MIPLKRGYKVITMTAATATATCTTNDGKIARIVLHNILTVKLTESGKVQRKNKSMQQQRIQDDGWQKQLMYDLKCEHPQHSQSL